MLDTAVYIHLGLHITLWCVVNCDLCANVGFHGCLGLSREACAMRRRLCSCLHEHVFLVHQKELSTDTNAADVFMQNLHNEWSFKNSRVVHVP